jgi:hypothetical protein
MHVNIIFSITQINAMQGVEVVLCDKTHAISTVTEFTCEEVFVHNVAPSRISKSWFC